VAGKGTLHETVNYVRNMCLTNVREREYFLVSVTATALISSAKLTAFIYFLLETNKCTIEKTIAYTFSEFYKKINSSKCTAWNLELFRTRKYQEIASLQFCKFKKI
jgi:hypothetical protein